MNSFLHRDRSLINAWLFVGVVMVFFQIMLGGITRLTGSGLSITKWEIVTGTLPPLNKTQWEEEFELYRQTPQYQKINAGMTLQQFKFIFFWEYIHRLWARTMGFVFLFPFLIFLFRKSIDSWLLKRLLIVILLAGCAAVFGWIMVASGLVNRPWVNAYKLTIHLGLGIALFVYLFFTWFHRVGFNKSPLAKNWIKWVKVLVILVIIQLAFGGFVSGMKAALSFPTWPLMHGSYIPNIITEKGHWNIDSFLMYDQSGFMPALVQFIHRNLGYVIGLISITIGLRLINNLPKEYKWIGAGLIGTIVVQVLLGILTLIYSKGSIPVYLGAFHQGVGILFFTYVLYIRKLII